MVAKAIKMFEISCGKVRVYFLRLSDENVEISSLSFEFFLILSKDGCCLFKLKDEKLRWITETKYWKQK